jgi:integrase
VAADGEASSDAGYVFTDELGSPLHPEYSSTGFETLSDRAGLRRIRLHDLRHTPASQMIAAGESPKVVAEMLGHAFADDHSEHHQHVRPGRLEAPGERLSDSLLG